MFWFKKKTEEKKTGAELKIRVIPDDFYGGKDPVIHYQRMEKKQAEVPGKSFFTKHQKVIYLVSGLGLLVFVVLASWYYINQARQLAINTNEEITLVEKTPLSPVEKKEVLPPPEEEKVEPVTTTSEATTSIEFSIPTTTVIQKPLLMFSNINYFDSQDSDADSLTNIEEEVFGTDFNKWDTDGDGYYDGQEVVNLYNPQGFAPIKIVDSGLVKEYVNPVWQYRLYFPANWDMGSVDPQASQVLFSAANGDFISVEVFRKQDNEDFAGWFAKEAKGQQFSDLMTFKNRFQEDGWKRKDSMVAYFEADKRIFTIIYHSVDPGAINYRHIMIMVMNSFRPGKTVIEIPDQSVLALPPEFNSSITSTQ